MIVTWKWGSSKNPYESNCTGYKLGSTVTLGPQFQMFWSILSYQKRHIFPNFRVASYHCEVCANDTPYRFHYSSRFFSDPCVQLPLKLMFYPRFTPTTYCIVMPRFWPAYQIRKKTQQSNMTMINRWTDQSMVFYMSYKYLEPWRQLRTDWNLSDLPVVKTQSKRRVFFYSPPCASLH